MEQPDPADETIDTAAEAVASDPLVQLFGDSPRTRILVVLRDAAEPMNPASIYEQAGIAQRTWYNHVDALEETGLMVQSGQAGNSPLYRLANEDELPRGDDRVECLHKLTDWTSRSLRENRTQNDTTQ